MTPHDLQEDSTKRALLISVRLKATAKTFLALFPITLALLPGFAKGALRVKTVLPESALVSYILATVPILQVPLLACCATYPCAAP